MRNNGNPIHEMAGLSVDGAVTAGFIMFAAVTGESSAVIAEVLGVSPRSLFKKSGKDIFRVVDDVELADIKKISGFRTTPGAFEGKQFVDNLDDAKVLQQKFSKFFGCNQTIVPAQVPQSVLDKASKIPFADIPKGKAITIPKSDLSSVIPKL